MFSTESTPHPSPSPPENIKLTRDSLISPEHFQNAIQGGRMYIYDVDSGMPVQTTLPAEYVQSGRIPEGYCVDFAFDPATAVSTLMQSGISTVDQLPRGLLDSMKATINDSKNLVIVPVRLYAAKLQSILSTIQSMDGKEKDE